MSSVLAENQVLQIIERPSNNQRIQDNHPIHHIISPIQKPQQKNSFHRSQAGKLLSFFK